MPVVIKNGIAYNVNPNVVGASELTVTTPEIEVVASKKPFESKQFQLSLAHANGLTQQERIAANKREGNIASLYFNTTPSIGNLVKGAYHWLQSKPLFLGYSEAKNVPIMGIAPSPTLKNSLCVNYLDYLRELITV